MTSESILSTYTKGRIMTYKLNNLLETMVTADLQNNVVPMLVGEPAIGKSSWVEALGRELGTKTFTLQCNEIAEKADLTGSRTVPINDAKTKYKQIFFPHADIMDAIEYAREHPDEKPILFMDEINRTSSDVTSALLSIPTRRKIGSEELPDNLAIIIAGNNKGNVTVLDEASVSRFIIYTVEPDADTFLRVNPDINPIIEQLLMRDNKLIFCKGLNPIESTDPDNDDVDHIMDMFDDDTMEQFSAPRTISALSKKLNALSEDFLRNLNLEQTVVTHRGEQMPVTGLMEMLIAHVGYTEFTIRLYDDIIKAMSQSKAATVAKPAFYDTLVTNHTSTISDIVTFAKGLSDDEKSATIMYALTDKVTDLKVLRPVLSEFIKLTPVFSSEHLDAYVEKHKDGTLVMALNNYIRTKQDLQATTFIKYLKAVTHD